MRNWKISIAQWKKNEVKLDKWNNKLLLYLTVLTLNIAYTLLGYINGEEPTRRSPRAYGVVSISRVYF